MSHRKENQGICHLCGNYGDLTLEHVPPRAAFNNRRTIKVEFEDVIKLGPDEPAKGPVQQGGISYYTLCAQCNNNTGRWYGKHFVAWCYQGMSILQSTGGTPTLIYMNYIFPLSILKQIITMFFSVNNKHFGLKNPELVDFVLNKQKRHLSPRYRFFVYYNLSSRFRSSGVTGRLNILTSEMKLFSEIAFPPFGYVLSIDSDPPDKRLYEITHFSHYCYNEFKVMNLQLPPLPVHSWIPGDYRDKEQINETYKRNIEIEHMVSKKQGQ